MYTAIIALVACSVGACVGLVVGGLCAIQKDPAASRTPLPDAGGSWAGFDLLPERSLLALASPLAEFEPPAMGRGLHIDRYCADDVAVTITNDRIWLDVDGNDSVRVYRIKRLSIDDRRATP